MKFLSQKTGCALCSMLLLTAWTLVIPASAAPLDVSESNSSSLFGTNTAVSPLDESSAAASASDADSIADEDLAASDTAEVSAESSASDKTAASTEVDVPVFLAVENACVITVDGDPAEWANVPMQSSSNSSVTKWAVAKDSNNLYFYMQGNGGNVYYQPFTSAGMSFAYGSGTPGTNYIGFSGTFDQAWGASGASLALAESTTAANSYEAECSLPLSNFGSGDFTLNYCGVSLPVAQIPDLATIEQPIVQQPVYSGIAIDGAFQDWAAVPKTALSSDGLHAAAAVYDGDSMYIYLQEDSDWCSTWAGPGGNGKYAITADLGSPLLFQLNQNGTVSGIGGMQGVHSNRQWEIAIPKSALPTYKDSLNFGFYLGDTFVSGITNLQPEDNSDKTFDGIVYDGLYGDWTYYPHTEIEYATAGTHEIVADAQAALYASGSSLFGHVVTTMPQHLQEAGNEFSFAVTIRLNDNLDFYPRLVAVDSNGKIDWNAKTSYLNNGTYEFYLVDTNGWSNADNIRDLEPNNALYGKITMTIGSACDEMEYEMDLNKLADHFGLEPGDIKIIQAQYGRIGQQWVTTAGTSSGPYWGIALCMLSVPAVLALRRRHLWGQK